NSPYGFLLSIRHRRPAAPLFPYTTLFRSLPGSALATTIQVNTDVDTAFPVDDGHCGLREATYAASNNISPNPSIGECAAGSAAEDRKSTRLNSSHSQISYAVFCLEKKTSR